VNLKLFEISFIGDETLIQQIDINYQDLLTTLPIVYNMLTNCAFLRIILNERKHQLSLQEKISPE
jgi:hypothetical protein